MFERDYETVFRSGYALGYFQALIDQADIKEDAEDKEVN